MTHQAARHFLDLSLIAPEALISIIRRAHELKAARPASPRFPGRDGVLGNHVLALYFEQPSTRTRISFDLAMRELGGQTLMLSHQELQLKRGESIADTARVISRYADAIMIRALDHASVTDFAAASQVAVINGLTRLSHPCQIMADIMTFEEHRGPVAGRKFAWCGDVNNVLVSLAHAADAFGFSLHIACPEALQADEDIRAELAKYDTVLDWTHDPAVAVRDADCVLTDVWRSLGDDETGQSNIAEKFGRFQINDALMRKAPDTAIFMHCLPAHRGEEVTDSVIDGRQSVVFDEAENRLHAQKAILEWCLVPSK